MHEPAHDPIQPGDAEPRHLPVHAPVVEARPIERAPAGGLQAWFASLPAPAVAAAGGFIMGVVTWVAVRVLRGGGRRRSLGRAGRRGRRGVEIASSRSFLVDVHLLKDR
ncbi:MAG TPA: hypothetical protein VF032_11885 [Thermoleophilaceae bacterium]